MPRVLETIGAFLAGEKSLHLKFLNFNNNGDKSVSKSTTEIGTQINNNINITINGPLTAEAKQQLQPLLDAYENKELLFLAEEPKRLLNDVKSHEDDDLVRGLIHFFKGKLSTRDLQLMRTGLYLQYLRDTNKRAQASTLWQQVSANSSSRERKIVNLASAGYFHTYFRPLYKQLLKVSNTEAKFKKEYESILDDTTFAIFVHSNMTEEEIVDETVNKAAKNIKYGVKIETISIHATGAPLVTRVKAVCEKLKPKFPDMKTVIAARGLNVITVSINYRRNNLTAIELNLED